MEWNDYFKNSIFRKSLVISLILHAGLIGVLSAMGLYIPPPVPKVIRLSLVRLPPPQQEIPMVSPSELPPQGNPDGKSSDKAFLSKPKATPKEKKASTQKSVVKPKPKPTSKPTPKPKPKEAAKPKPKKPVNPSPKPESESKPKPVVQKNKEAAAPVPSTPEAAHEEPALSLDDILDATSDFEATPTHENVPQQELSNAAKSLLEGIDTVDVIEFGTDETSTLGVPGGTQISPEDASIFHQHLKSTITPIWGLPPQLRGLKLQAMVRFRIKRNGEIVSATLEKRSESDLFNSSIQALLKHLKYLPALPDSYPDQQYELGVRFTPGQF